MQMIEIAAGVTQLALMPRQSINAYLIGGILVDAGIRSSAQPLLQMLNGRPLQAHVLTHAHPDHQGASAAICAARHIPLWCSAAERESAELGQPTRAFPQPNDLIARMQQRFFAGLAWPVARILQEGDLVEDFTVLATPGHTPGHIAFWREHDRVLILGDVLNNMNLLTTRQGLHEPPARFTSNSAQNRESIRRVAALRPAIVAFGHGPVLRDPERLAAFAAALP
jgi:glyoxylase-like metal-dependent hydrolase (beta-lactamase superfamily II)